MEQELYHHGIKGQRWGIRRYQNKDGSLTKAGQKRYNQEMSELKSEQKTLKAQLRTQKKMGKLETLKDENEALKKTVADDESPEVKRARLLKSTDAKELYENRDLLTTAELNERINRIDTEARLSSKIVEEHQKTGMEIVTEKMQTWSDRINTATNLYNKVDSAYSTVAKSEIGKTLAKKMGLETPKKEFDINKVWENRNKMSDEELKKVSNRVQSEKNIKQYMDKLSDNSSSNSKNSGMTADEIADYIEQYLDSRDQNG